MAHRNGSTGSRSGRVRTLLDRLALAVAGIQPERTAALGDFLDGQEATGESDGTGLRITFGNATADHQGAGIDGLRGRETGGGGSARSSSTVPEK